MAVLRFIGYIILGFACLLALGVFSGYLVCRKHTLHVINKSAKTWYTSFKNLENLTPLAPGQAVSSINYNITEPNNKVKKIKVIVADTAWQAHAQPIFKIYEISFSNTCTQVISACIQEDGTLVTQDGHGPILVSTYAPTQAPAAKEREKSEYKVELTNGGPNKIQTIKALRQVTTLGLTEAKKEVEEAPTVLTKTTSKGAAEKMKKTLEAAGAQVTLSS